MTDLLVGLAKKDALPFIEGKPKACFCEWSHKQSCLMGRSPFESSIKKKTQYLMDVNKSMRKRLFPFMFYCFILSSGSSLSKCGMFVEAVGRTFPKEKYRDSLIFVHSAKCCLDGLWTISLVWHFYNGNNNNSLFPEGFLLYN